MPTHYVPKATTRLSLTPADGFPIGSTDTNDDASAGQIGEYVSSLVATGSAVSLTTATAANVTSISLTAGDWDVEAGLNINFGSATTTASSGGISATSATLPTDGSEASLGTILTTTTTVAGRSIQRKRVSVSTTTTIYLVASATFSAGTAAAWGTLNARRVR